MCFCLFSVGLDLGNSSVDDDTSSNNNDGGSKLCLPSMRLSSVSQSINSQAKLFSKYLFKDEGKCIGIWDIIMGS